MATANYERNPHHVRAVTLIIETDEGTTSQTFYANQLNEFGIHRRASYRHPDGTAMLFTTYNIGTMVSANTPGDPTVGPPAPVPTGYAARSVMDEAPPTTGYFATVGSDLLGIEAPEKAMEDVTPAPEKAATPRMSHAKCGHPGTAWERRKCRERKLKIQQAREDLDGKLLVARIHDRKRPADALLTTREGGRTHAIQWRAPGVWNRSGAILTTFTSPICRKRKRDGYRAILDSDLNPVPWGQLDARFDCVECTRRAEKLAGQAGPDYEAVGSPS